MSPSLNYWNTSELHTKVAHDIDIMKKDSSECFTFLPFLSYSFKTLKPDVMRGWYLFYKRRKTPSAHTFTFFLLIWMLIVFDRLVICCRFFFFNHNSFSAVLLSHCTFYTLVHRKYCCFLTILFLPVITHSRGLHESLRVNCGSDRRLREQGRKTEEEEKE